MAKTKKAKETLTPPREEARREAHFPIFQVLMFAFLFAVMLWIIGFLSLELDNQKKELSEVRHELETIKKGGEDLLNSYVGKIRDLQQIDVKEQVQALGASVRDEVRDAVASMPSSSDMAKLARRVEAVEEYNNTYRGTNALLLTSAGLLREAIMRGQPFEAELASVAAIGGRQGAAGQAALALSPYAKNGVGTIEGLSLEFGHVADEAAFMARNPLGAEPGWRERLWGRIKGLVKIRRLDAAEELSTPEAIVARTEEALKAGDAAGAVSQFAKMRDMYPEGFEAGRGWFERASAKVFADGAIDALMSHALEKAVSDIKRNERKGE